VLERSDLAVFYTDGLIEQRTESLDAGLQRLAEAATAAAGERPEALRDELLDRTRVARRDDDVSLLVVRVSDRTAAPSLERARRSGDRSPGAAPLPAASVATPERGP
jgi:hypothetical protein